MLDLVSIVTFGWMIQFLYILLNAGNTIFFKFITVVKVTFQFTTSTQTTILELGIRSSRNSCNSSI